MLAPFYPTPPGTAHHVSFKTSLSSTQLQFILCDIVGNWKGNFLNGKKLGVMSHLSSAPLISRSLFDSSDFTILADKVCCLTDLTFAM